MHRDFVPQLIEFHDKSILTKETVKICGINFSNNVNYEYELNVLEKIEKMEKQLIIWLQRALSIEGKILIVKTFGLSQLIYSLQMCEVKDSELIDIERIIFKFLWNKKWVGSSAPDRIKRIFLKQSYSKGGLNVPDIGALNSALKAKQFSRAMNSSHPINLIQKYQLERIGYFEYYKCEYAKLCKRDPIVHEYQKQCNFWTDVFRNILSTRPLVNTEDLSDNINIVASTDVLEYLKRKNYPMIITRYARLANLGICTFAHLLSEARFPRTDDLGNLAKYILRFFPEPWVEAVTSAEDVDGDLTYENEFPILGVGLQKKQGLTVKILRRVITDMLLTPPQPYLTNPKFELTNPAQQKNPFLLLRKALHSPRD